MKKNLFLTAAITSSLLGYYRKAYSAHVNCAGSAGVYSCSGSATTTQTITADNAQVSTAPGFSLSVGANLTGFAISGNGALSFKDENASSISAGNFGLNIISNNDSGPTKASIDISINGEINLASEAVEFPSTTGIYSYIKNGSGSTTINISGDIYANNNNGIYSRGMIESENISITTTSSSIIDVSGNNSNAYSRGIMVKNYGSGSNIFNISGDIYANSYGIYSYGSVNDTSITTTSDSKIDVDRISSFTNSRGIGVINNGAGPTILNISGDIDAREFGIHNYVAGANANSSITTTSESVINVSKNNSTGIRSAIYGQNSTATLNISGDINANAYGIYAYGSSETSSISLTTTADSKIDISGENSGNLNSKGIRVKNDGNSTILNIAGDIYAKTFGISVYAMSESNDISITTENTSQIISQNQGIYAHNLGSGTTTLNLSGDITTTNDAAVFIHKSANSPANITIQNGATISGAKAITSAPAGDVAFNLTLDGSNNAVSLTGTSGVSIQFDESAANNDNLNIIGDVAINGDINAGAGADTLNFNNARLSLSNESTIDNFETITVSGDNILTGSFDFSQVSILTNSNSALKVNGSLAIANLELAENSTLSGNNTITGNVTANSGSTIAPGNSIGTINVTGNVVFEEGSTFDVEIDGNNADKIVANGTISIDAGAILKITPINNSTSGSATILESQAGITGTFTNVVNNTNGRVSLLYSDNLKVSFITTNTATFAAQVQSSINNSILFNDTLANQMTLDAFEKGRKFWVRSIYRNQDTKNLGEANSFKNTAGGLAIGVENDLNDSTRIGFSLSQIKDDLKVKNNQGSRENESSFAAIYAIHHKKFCKATLLASASLGFGYHNSENLRLVNNSGINSYARSSTNDKDFNATIQTGAKFKMANGWYSMPLVSLSYIKTYADGFSESDGGISNVTVKDYSFSTVKLRESMRFGKKELNFGSLKLAPFIELGLAQERAVDKRKISGSFSTGDKFTSNLNKNNRNFTTAALGTNLKITENISGFVNYEKSYSKQENRDEFKLGIGIKF